MLTIHAIPTHMAGKGQMYRCEVDGETVAEGVRVPFCTAARALIEAGRDPDQLCTMRLAGVAHDSFEPIPLRAAAHWTAREPDAASVRLVRYVERDFTTGSVAPAQSEGDGA